MTIHEIIKLLVTSDNYLEARLTVSDDAIDLIKEHMPSQYDLFAEKEEAFINLSKILQYGKIYNSKTE